MAPPLTTPPLQAVEELLHSPSN